MDSIIPDGSAAMPAGVPGDVLIVEDDAIIALDFEQTVAEFGVTSVRIASSVARALAMIAERVPDFALLDIGLSRGKELCCRQAAGSAENPVCLCHRATAATGPFHRNIQTGPSSQNRFRGMSCSRFYRIGKAMARDDPALRHAAGDGPLVRQPDALVGRSIEPEPYRPWFAPAQPHAQASKITSPGGRRANVVHGLADESAERGGDVAWPCQLRRLRDARRRRSGRWPSDRFS